jgi:outer membrane protein insertion porin family
MRTLFHMRRAFIALLLLQGSQVLAQLALNGRVIASIRSEELDPEDLAALSLCLGIKEGKALNELELDSALKVCGDSGKWIRVFVEANPDGNRVTLAIRGVRVRRLRRLEYVGIDESVLEEVKRKYRSDLEQTSDTHAFQPLRQWIREAYQERGYYFAAVAFKTNVVNAEEADVDVVVVPNIPTRIGKLSVVGAPEADIPAIRDLIPLQKGDIFSRRQLGEGTDKINAYLRANQYPSSRVSDTDLKFSEDSSLVDVIVRVKMGERFQIRFVSNSVFDDVQLRALVTDDVLSQSDPSVRIIQLIEAKYRTVGYPDCSVQVKKSSEEQGKLNLIELHINEGQRAYIQSLRFASGNEVNGIELDGLFYENAPSVVQRKLYWADGVNEAIASMQSTLLAQGYLNARVGDPKATFSEDRKRVSLFIDADLGVQTRVGKITFVGNKQLAPSELIKQMAFETGEPFNKEKVIESAKHVTEYYGEQGFPLAKLLQPPEKMVEISMDQQLAEIRFEIDEGERFKIGDVRIEGLRKTKARVLLQECPFSTGDQYNARQIRQAEETISLLGLFSRVEFVETPSTTPGVMDIRILVQETRPGVGEVGFGGVYEEPRLRLRPFFGVAYRNVSGLNQTASVRADLGLPISRSGSEIQIPFVEYSTVLGYRYPYALNLPMTLATQVGFDRVEVRPAEQTLLTRARIEARLEKKFSPRLTTIYRLIRVERTTTESYRPADGGSSVPLTESIGSTGPGIILDFRDDIFNPRKGSFHSLDLELATPLLFSQANISFVLALMRNSFYLPVTRSIGLVFFAGLGYAQSLFSGSPIARARLVNELSLGGQGSIRGIAPRALTASDPTTTEGIAYYNARAEVNVGLFDDFGIAAFFDSGQIFPGFRPMDRADGFGLGLRYKTPVGPVVIDFAQGIGSLAQNVKFYFTVGTL